MDLGLHHRRAVITGAGRGIGRAIAQTLAREGAAVALLARTRADLDEVAAQVRGAGGVAHVIVGDVATEAGAGAALQEARLALGGDVELLINNVGGSQGTGAFDVADAAAWRAVVDLNLMSAVWCSQAVVPAMKARGAGVIIHVASVFGREYGPSAPYVAAKGGLIALTKEMGVDLIRHGIRVCSVAPGSILFPGGSWDRRRTQDPARFEKVLRDELPAGRFGTAEEVAAVVAFLCSMQASWLTGVTIPVDGGQGRAL